MIKITESIYDYVTFIGKAFYAQTSDVLTSGQTIYYLGITDSKLNTFMEDRSIKCISTNQDISVDTKLYEDAIVTDNGTQISEYNNNRDEPRMPTFDIYRAPAITDVGTDLMRGNKIRAARNEAASETDRRPYKMKKNSNYILEITNNTTNNVEVRIFWAWWENGDIA